MERKKVAIVGSGCAGLGALWALKSTDHEVHLFEAASRLGGHTNTVTWESPSGEKTPVDTGFIVYNEATYPNLINFFKHEHLPTLATEMTFGVSRDRGAFEWAGTSISSIFAQRRNILRPGMWRLLFDIVRFNQLAIDLLRHDNKDNEITIGEYLDRGGYSQSFRDDYLIPMTAAVWSTSPDKCTLQFPAVTLVRFMWNHHLLNTLSERSKWRTIQGGCNRYIDAIMRDFPKDHVHIKSRVTGMSPSKDGPVILDLDDRQEKFDHVILAVHGDQAMQLMKPKATKEEASILGCFQTNKNIAILHSDTTLMPQRRGTWAAWNYITQSPDSPSISKNVAKVCLTYWMNCLQHIPEDKFGTVLVTLNPLTPPDPRLVQGIWEYNHPLYNNAAIRAQKLLSNIQNARGVSYAGAWTKYGFHEDGFSSGLSVAINHLGAKLPFDFVDSTYSRGRRPEYTLKRLFIRVVLLYMYIWIGLFELLTSSIQRILAYRPKQKSI